MARAQVPGVVDAFGRPKEGAKLESVTDADGAPLTCFTNRIGSTEVTFPIFSDAEGAYDCWAESKTAQMFFEPGTDVIHNPAMVELVSGDQMDDMLVIGDLPGISTVENTVSPVDFGADPTGTTPCNDALFEALAWVEYNGGVLDLGAPKIREDYIFGETVWPDAALDSPLPRYLIASPGIEIGTNRRPWRITASNRGFTTSSGQRGATLLFDLEPGDPYGLRFESVNKFSIENVAFEHLETGFDGDVLQFDGAGGDTQDFHIHHCTWQTPGARTARSALYMRKCIIGEIGPRNHFSGGIRGGIRFEDDSFIVGVDTHHNTFNNNGVDIFVGPGDFEKNSFHHNVHEVSTAIEGGRTVKGDGVNNSCYAFSYHDNWHGDKSGAGSWMKDLRSLRGPGNVYHNLFASWGGSPDADCVVGFEDHWRFVGNTFLGGGGSEDAIFSNTSQLDLELQGNHAYGVDYLVRDTPRNLVQLPGAGEMPSANYAGGAQGGVNFGGTKQMGFGDGVLSAGSDFDPATTGGRFLLGVLDTGLVSLVGDQVAIYYSDGALILQTIDGNNEVKIVAGSNPNAPIRVGDDKLGFFNITPVTKETGVAVTAAAVHAALVRLGLIAA